MDLYMSWEITTRNGPNKGLLEHSYYIHFRFANHFIILGHTAKPTPSGFEFYCCLMRWAIKSSCCPFCFHSFVLPPTSVRQWRHSGERNGSRLSGSSLPPLGSHWDCINMRETLFVHCFSMETCRWHELPFNVVKKPRGRRPPSSFRTVNTWGCVGKLRGGYVDLHLRSVSVTVTAGHSLLVFSRNEPDL